MNLQPAKRFEWERIVRRCMIPRQAKFVAFTLAQYGSAAGESIRPGVGRLAAVCDMGESTIRRHLDVLVRLGLIERISNGGGPNKLAAKYRLTVPEDLLERVQMLDPEERTPLASVSAVHRGNSAHVDERSTPQNSAHFETELRSFGEGTPLISGPNSAHLGERPPQTKSTYQPTLTRGSAALQVTSPDEGYEQALRILQRLEDWGTSLMERAPDEMSARERVFWAAEQAGRKKR